MRNEKETLIAAFTPAFAEREVLWFSEHTAKIKQLALSDPFWARHILFIEKDLRIQLSELLRKLDEFHYEKTQRVSAAGEFSVQGGTLCVFPINLDHPVRIEFIGNRIDAVIALPKENALQNAREKLLKHEMIKREITHLSNLKPGDYLVHIDHGIGIFKGISLGNSVSKLEQERYYLIEYAAPKEGREPDRLRVPETQAKKLSLYLGLERPTIHRLSGTAWEHTKKKVTDDARAFAKELLSLYADRERARREPYQEDLVSARVFDDAFPHIETGDQKKAIEEVLADMGKEKPMDRLVCGDVGFGKTEVALRSAFRAVMAGKQAVVLAPTTILADQHCATFTERFAPFPVHIGILSRFENKRAQKETIKKLREGKIDILVGTHRALSADVAFKNLGLVIIDEEQRFGVRQKEKFKKMRAQVDMLSLSATPIPRTLYLSLSGLRQISVISTPPLERQPVDTLILPYDKKIIKSAIEIEMARGGQIYFLHNRVETLEITKRMLEELVPRAQCVSAHGKTPEHTLRDIMRRFKEGKADVLVATTIIENGLDIKNVNTLIVDDATRLGLAQAYQIRGRIGRAEKKAQAYFLYGARELGDNARKRLEALEEATALGSGYFIAQRDLEIRGAGNILGKKQSGAVNQVGLNLYCQILAEAVEQLHIAHPPFLS